MFDAEVQLTSHLTSTLTQVRKPQCIASLPALTSHHHCRGKEADMNVLREQFMLNILSSPSKSWPVPYSQDQTKSPPHKELPSLAGDC